MSQRREKKLRQLERRVAALEAKTAKDNPEVYYWTESAEREQDAERMRQSEPGYRLAMGVGGSAESGGIFQRIAAFFRGR